jgi:hypothetical protein
MQGSQDATVLRGSLKTHFRMRVFPTFNETISGRPGLISKRRLMKQENITSLTRRKSMTPSYIHNRLQSMAALAVGLCALVLSRPALVAADGDLDLTFAPASEFDYTGMPTFLTVIDDHLYYQRFNSPIQRLQSDGSLDPEWSIPLTYVAGALILELRKVTWGAWLFQTFDSAYLNLGTGDSQRNGV